MCAVIGMIHTGEDFSEDLSEDAYKALCGLQHRGQDASGMISFDHRISSFCSHKGVGLVQEVFKEPQSFEQLKGNIIVGHNRYTTVGSKSWDNIQPMSSNIVLAHNGNLVNFYDLKDEIQTKNEMEFSTENDLECFLKLFNIYAEDKELTHLFVESIFKKIVEKVVGAYSLVGLIPKLGLLGLRDPHGIRPLVLGKKDGKYCLSSETGGLDYSGFEYVRDIEPGEFLLIDFNGKLHSKKITSNKSFNFCMFEWVYFAGTESKINNLPVYESRLKLGNYLGEQIKELIDKKEICPDIVSPVPDTSRTAAIALSEKLNLPYRESLVKNRYIHRSFILNNQKMRRKAIDHKWIPIKSEIEGKNILLIDDSIVRGNSLKRIVKLLKSSGVNDIYFGLTCPPIKNSCFYGIDFPDENELVAKNRNLDEIVKETGVTKIIYLDLKNLNKALLKGSLCTGCLNEDYPVGKEFFASFKKERLKNR